MKPARHRLDVLRSSPDRQKNDLAPTNSEITLAKENQAALRSSNLQDEFQSLTESLNGFRSRNSFAKRKATPLNLETYDLLKELKRSIWELENRKLSVEAWEKLWGSVQARIEAVQVSSPEQEKEPNSVEIEEFSQLMEFKRWIDENEEEVRMLRSGECRNQVEDQIGQTECQISAMDLKIRGLHRQLEEAYNKQKAILEKRQERQQDIERERSILEERLKLFKQMIQEARKRKKEAEISREEQKK